MAFPNAGPPSGGNPQSVFSNQNEHPSGDVNGSSVPQDTTGVLQQPTINNPVGTIVERSFEAIVDNINEKNTPQFPSGNQVAVVENISTDSNEAQDPSQEKSGEIDFKTPDNNAVYNAEWDGRTPLQETVIATIDTVNGVRNTISIVGTSAAFPTLATMPKASLIAGGTIAGASFMFLLTGVLSIIVCIASLIPLGLEELKNSSKELEAAIASKIKDRIDDAVEALQEAKLCLANFIGALVMGICQIAEGAVSICTTPLLTKAFHIHAFSSATLKASFVTGSGCALGAVYVFRGSIQAYRAVKNLKRVNQFYEEFKQALDPNNANLDTSIEFLNAKRGIGENYWGRRVDTSCLKEKALTSSSTDEEKIIHLQEVDKGIYSLKLKNQISLIVAAAMIIGGIISIVLSFCTGGIAPLIFSLICFVAFTSMEFIFLSSDVTSIYQWLLDRMYVQSQELRAFLEAIEKNKQTVVTEIKNPDQTDVTEEIVM